MYYGDSVTANPSKYLFAIVLDREHVIPLVLLLLLLPTALAAAAAGGGGGARFSI